MILGTDAAGVDPDGNEVVVHAVISDPDWRADETLDPNRSLLSERHQGTMAERVMVPRRNLVPKPPTLSFEEAACLPTAWLTAYRMLFTRAGVRPGSTVLVQGAGGGVATALVTLGAAAGARMWVTSRDPDKAGRAVEFGADQVFRTGERLPERVDAVMETVGAATWQHSLRSLRPGGTVVLSGATSGRSADTELSRIFFLQLRVLGSTMGTRHELEQSAHVLLAHRRPPGCRPGTADETGARGLCRTGAWRGLRQGRSHALSSPPAGPAGQIGCLNTEPLVPTAGQHDVGEHPVTGLRRVQPSAKFCSDQGRRSISAR